MRKGLKIDGFRKGKVPEGLAKRILKPNVMLKFSNQVIDKTHLEAVKVAGVEEYLDMHVVDLDFDENQPFNYTIKIEVDPEISLPDYKKGYKVTRNEYIVDPETIEHYITDSWNRRLKSRMFRWRSGRSFYRRRLAGSG
jgi:trigger factor